jgi:hypothetical protein
MVSGQVLELHTHTKRKLDWMPPLPSYYLLCMFLDTHFLLKYYFSNSNVSTYHRGLLWGLVMYVSYQMCVEWSINICHFYSWWWQWQKRWWWWWKLGVFVIISVSTLCICPRFQMWKWLWSLVYNKLGEHRLRNELINAFDTVLKKLKDDAQSHSKAIMLWLVCNAHSRVT